MLSSDVRAKQSDDAATPVMIVTGYLGAGKSTLVRHILTSDEHKKRVFVVNNELASPIGAENEYQLPAASIAAVDVFESENGCACCGGAESFADKLRAVAKRRARYDLVVIETDGVVDPSFAAVFVTDPVLARAFVIVGVIAVVDASQPARLCEGPSFTREAVEQIRFCDRIILNKMDLVEQAHADSVAARLRELNALAELVRATNAQVSLASMLDTRAFNVQKMLEELRTSSTQAIHEIQLRPLVLLAREPVHIDAFKRWLSAILSDPSNRIFRVKGVLIARDPPQRYVLQGVAGTFSLTELTGSVVPLAGRCSKIVLIGEKLRREALVESACAALETRVVDELMIPFLPGPEVSIVQRLSQQLFGWLLAINLAMLFLSPARTGLLWLADAVPVTPIPQLVAAFVGYRVLMTGVLLLCGAFLAWAAPPAPQFIY